MVLTCDFCLDDYDDEFRSEEEALESGWFIVRGPERELGGNGEKVYCSHMCMVADL